MGQFIPVPNVVLAEVFGTCAPYTWAHVLHYQYTGGPPSAASLQAGSAVLFSSFQQHFGVAMTAGIVQTGARLTDLASQTGAAAETLGSQPGTLTGTALPFHTAFLINKAINRRYKGGHPRAYLLVGSTIDLAGPTTWTNSFITTMTNAYAAFISSTANGGMWAGVGPEVTVHRKQNHAILQTPLVDIVQSYTGSPGLASQRRRIGR